MDRDFTQATKERLLHQIDKVEKEKWSWLTDALGDVTLRVGKWFNLLSIDSDMKNIKSYHKSVIDMTNMTKKQLRDIFDKVYSDDKLYSSNFASLNERQSLYNSKILDLSNMINPNFSIASAAEIKGAMTTYNKQLKSIDGKIAKEFKKEIDFAAKEAMKESGKGILKSVIDAGVTILTMPVTIVKGLLTGNIFSIVSPVFNLIDDVFSLGSNLAGLFSGFALLGDNNDTKQRWLGLVKPYAGVSGLTEALEADIEVNGENVVTRLFLKISKGMDTVSGVCAIADLGYSIFKNPGKIFDTKFGFKTKISGFSKKDIMFKTKTVQKVEKDWIKYQGVYYRMQKNHHYIGIKNAKKFYDYMDAIFDKDESADKTVKQFLKNSNYVKILDEINDTYETVKSY